MFMVVVVIGLSLASLIVWCFSGMEVCNELGDISFFGEDDQFLGKFIKLLEAGGDGIVPF